MSENAVTVADVRRYQLLGWSHEFTCRKCRGMNDACPRKWLNKMLRRRDEHILIPEEFKGRIFLACRCCKFRQILDKDMARHVHFVLDNPPWKFDNPPWKE